MRQISHQSFEIEKRVNNFYSHLFDLVNSERAIQIFPQRVASMIETLNKVSQSSTRVFVIGGKSHFIEGEDAAANPNLTFKDHYLNTSHL